MTANRKKLVIVGDCGCGKTCLLYAFLKNKFLYPHAPSVLEVDATEIEVDGKKVELELWDDGGELEEYRRLRLLRYVGADVILMCFSIDNPHSLDNITRTWIDEIKQTSCWPNVPVILVGNKKDLRNDELMKEKLSKIKQEPVKSEEGSLVCERIKAYAYLECSAKTREGVREVFKTAAKAVLRSKTENLPKKKCRIL